MEDTKEPNISHSLSESNPAGNYCGTSTLRTSELPPQTHIRACCGGSLFQPCNCRVYDEKEQLKNAMKIARISGLSKALVWGLAREDFNKEGAIKVANEISELADKFLYEVLK